MSGDIFRSGLMTFSLPVCSFRQLSLRELLHKQSYDTYVVFIFDKTANTAYIGRILHASTTEVTLACNRRYNEGDLSPIIPTVFYRITFEQSNTVVHRRMDTPQPMLDSDSDDDDENIAPTNPWVSVEISCYTLDNVDQMLNEYTLLASSFAHIQTIHSRKRTWGTATALSATLPHLPQDVKRNMSAYLGGRKRRSTRRRRRRQT